MFTSFTCALAALPLMVAGGPDDIAANFQTYEIPLTVHVVRPGDGTGGLSATRVALAIEDANEAFEAMGLYFCQLGETIFIDDDFYFFDLATSDDYAQLREESVVPDTINIYFTGNMGCPSPNQADCPNPAICGLSAYTYSPSQGIVLKNGCSGVPEDASTIAHELGHYFNLYHTHETYLGVECPDGSNCASDGDLICDTAAAPRLDLDNVTQFCEYDGDETACGDPYDPDPSNHMSYAPKPCRDFFSVQQAAKVRTTLENYRPELILDPGCPVPGACSAASGDCTEVHDSPGCNDVSCCEDVCALDLYCCAAGWDANCVWLRSLTCLDLAGPPWDDPPHAPLGDAVLTVEPASGTLVVSNIGATGDDGVVVELDFAEAITMTWLDPDPMGTLPLGATMTLSAMGWTGLPRPKPTGLSEASKQSNGTTDAVSITADLGSATNTVRIFEFSVLVAQAVVPSGAVATAPLMPTGGGIPAPLNDGPRQFWQWSTPVLLQIEGGPAAAGTRLEVHGNDGPAVRRYAMAALQASEIPQIEMIAETVQGPSGALNDHCESPALITEGAVPYLGESWYLYVAGCTGPATAATDTGDPVTVYAGHCGDLRAIGTGAFEAACGAPYLVRVAGAATGGMLTITCSGPCPTPCAADIDGDNTVGVLDFLGLLAAWGPNPGHPADFDGDGLVGILDFLFLLADWGPCPSLIG